MKQISVAEHEKRRALNTGLPVGIPRSEIANDAISRAETTTESSRNVEYMGGTIAPRYHRSHLGMSLPEATEGLAHIAPVWDVGDMSSADRIARIECDDTSEDERRASSIAEDPEVPLPASNIDVAAFLRSPALQELRVAMRQDPSVMEAVIIRFREEAPSIGQWIRENQDEFIEICFEVRLAY